MVSLQNKHSSSVSLLTFIKNLCLRSVKSQLKRTFDFLREGTYAPLSLKVVPGRPDRQNIRGRPCGWTGGNKRWDTTPFLSKELFRRLTPVSFEDIGTPTINSEIFHRRRLRTREWPSFIPTNLKSNTIVGHQGRRVQHIYPCVSKDVRGLRGVTFSLTSHGEALSLSFFLVSFYKTKRKFLYEYQGNRNSSPQVTETYLEEIHGRGRKKKDEGNVRFG